tara:strand:+ start:3177 stop:3518 length:342 start_codon:yes stop_codon:yes gene_type:complete
MIGGEHLYIMQMGRTGAIKVGRSSDVKRRQTEIQTGCPYEVRVLLVAEGQGWRERLLHRTMRRMRLRDQKGEWFSESAIGSIPDDLYDMMAFETVEMMNGDWWRSSRDPGPLG